MKKYLYLIVLAVIVFISCDMNKNNSADNTDTGTAVTSANTVADTLQNVIEVTPFELKDDSVFADGSIPSKWENAGITDVKSFKLFLKQLQIWVMNNDKEKLASAVKYPLKNIQTPEELLVNYDKIFTKDVKLSFATINFNQIFRNQNGAMTEGGKVWFAQQGQDFKIIAVNY